MNAPLSRPASDGMLVLDKRLDGTEPAATERGSWEIGKRLC